MASSETLCKRLLNAEHIVIESYRFYDDQDGVKHLRIMARPNAWHENNCPFCGKRCSGYDHAAKARKLWGSLDFG